MHTFSHKTDNNSSKKSNIQNLFHTILPPPKKNQFDKRLTMHITIKMDVY